MGAAAALFWYVSSALPDVDSLSNYRPPTVTTVYADDGRPIAEFYKERRYVVALAEIPIHLQQAVIATEDARFYDHPGFDILGIIRAFVTNLREGDIVEGASTITQQVAKSFFLTPERSYRRKIKEAILAYRIDRIFNKKEILYLYLNQIYFGHGAYGVKAAAKTYFDKPLSELSLAECALLAGLPKAPNHYSPRRHPRSSRSRQQHVLNRMLAEGYIHNGQYQAALREKLVIAPGGDDPHKVAPYYVEHVRRLVQEKYGGDAIYEDGLNIFTALNPMLQKAAQEEVESRMAHYDERQKFQGPEERWPAEKVAQYQKGIGLMPKATVEIGSRQKGVVTRVGLKDERVEILFGRETGWVDAEGLRWAEDSGWEPAIGDVVHVRVEKAVQRNENEGWLLTVLPAPGSEAALLCLETDTGHVKAMVGGRDFLNSQFNRALQAKRQAGSAFKPIVYAAALDNGYTPATAIIDTAVVFYGEAGDPAWKPHNYSQHFYGPVLLREALAKSLNSTTVKVAQDIGVDAIIAYARQLGITSPLNNDLSAALGSSSLSLMELTSAYSVFANQGDRLTPTFVTRIEDRNGEIIEQNQPSPEKAIDADTAYLMTSMLQSVVKNGTGRRARALNRPSAGKTGTTDDWRDAWYIGYTPQYVTGVWVGRDDNTSLGRGETGARAALPIWLGFMQAAHRGKPERTFDIPSGIVFVRIDAETGLLPASASDNTRFECFKEGTQPEETVKGANEVVEDLFKMKIPAGRNMDECQQRRALKKGIQLEVLRELLKRPH